MPYACRILAGTRIHDAAVPVANLKYRYAIREDGWKLILPFTPNRDATLMIDAAGLASTTPTGFLSAGAANSAGARPRRGSRPYNCLRGGSTASAPLTARTRNV